MANQALRKPAFIWGILMAVLAFSPLGDEFLGKTRLHHYEKELRAKGEELSVEDLMPPRLASDENGAAAFLTAASRLSNSPVLPAPCSLTRFVAPAKARVRWLEPEPDDDQSTNTWRALGRQIEAVRVHLTEVEKSLQRPRFDFGTKYGPRHDKEEMPHLPKVRRVASWVEAAALWELRENNCVEALNHIQNLVILSGTLKDEPLVLSQSVRLGVARMGLRATWEALESPGWTEAQLAGIQALWQTNFYAEDMLRSLEMERAIFAQTLDLLQQGDPLVTEEFFLPSECAEPDMLDRYMTVHVTAPLWTEIWGEQAKLHFLQQSQEMLEGGRRALETRNVTDWRAGCAGFNNWQNSSGSYDMVRFWPSFMFLSGVERTGLKTIQFETEKAMTITAIALKRYALRYSRCPPDLTALAPEFLSAQPLDYMAGKPFRYKLNSDEDFTLYSVGDDERDDGGDATLRPGKEEYYGLWTGRDAVWPTAATLAEIQTAAKASVKNRLAHPRPAPPTPGIQAAERKVTPGSQ